MYTNIGKPAEALRDAIACDALSGNDENSLSIAAISLHTMGRFHESLPWYDQLIQSFPDHMGYCQRDVAIVQARMLDAPFRSFLLDTVLSRDLKEVCVCTCLRKFACAFACACDCRCMCMCL